MSISTERWSVTEFMESTWSGDVELEGLDAVIGAIADGTRRVHDLVQAAALADVLGTTGETNPPPVAARLQGMPFRWTEATEARNETDPDGNRIRRGPSQWFVEGSY